MRLTRDVLIQASISFDPVKAAMAKRLLKILERQRVADATYRERHLEARRAADRERAPARTGYLRERENRPGEPERRKLMRLAREMHLEQGRPLVQIQRELGIEARSGGIACRCKACRKEAA